MDRIEPTWHELILIMIMKMVMMILKISAIVVLL